MSEETKIYALSEVSNSFMGVPLEEGYGDGMAIKIEPADVAFTTKVGADGSVVRCATGNKLYKITLSYLQTSAANQVLSGIHELDQLAANGAGVGPFFCRDRQGTSLHVFAKAWIVTAPPVEYSKEATNREWELAGVKTVHNIGSN